MSEVSHNQQRQIQFAPNQDEGCDIATAIIILNNIEGIYETGRVNADTLSVGYSLEKLTLEMIEELFIELGYRLDNNFINQSKRVLFYYVEECHRINNNLGANDNIKLDPKVLLANYFAQANENEEIDMGHWKKYL
ncbi:MAG: hypothetical protein JKY93_06985 [Gammaproteobacteria bacterium]|nr:hypothetical protein [Gammaproteobacteria bacterium]